MGTAANLFGLILFVIACVLILANWVVAHKNLENRRRGIDQHLSSVALLPQVVMLFSALCFQASRNPWFSAWFLAWVSSNDIALWLLLFQLPKRLLNKLRQALG